jgi:hypothetical protein
MWTRECNTQQHVQHPVTAGSRLLRCQDRWHLHPATCSPVQFGSHSLSSCYPQQLHAPCSDWHTQTHHSHSEMPFAYPQPLPSPPAGLTTWVALAAEELLKDPAPSIGPEGATTWPPSAIVIAAAAGSKKYGRAVLEEGLVGVWDRFYWVATTRPHSRSTALSNTTDWLHPAVLQLADKLLQRPLWCQVPRTVLHAMMAGVPIAAANPLVHPRLAAAAGLEPDPALAAQVAAALQQVGVGQLAPALHACWHRG